MNGTSLRLWVSEDITKRHHGRLSLKCRQGAMQTGTIFTMFLPFDAVIERAKVERPQAEELLLT